MSNLYELLKDHEYVFLDEDFINSDDIEEEIDNIRNNTMCSDDETLTVPVFNAKPTAKPCFDFDDIGELLLSFDYETEDMWSTDLLYKDQETLDKINALVHSLVSQIYTSNEELFSILIYADKEKDFEIIEKVEN